MVLLQFYVSILRILSLINIKIVSIALQNNSVFPIIDTIYLKPDCT